MNAPGPCRELVRFGTFEVDLQTGELRKHGLKLKLEHKPFQILALLLDHPGQLITRDELREELWPDVEVEFDNNLNAAINKLREALGDSADRPHFIETLKGRGYRFVYPVELHDEPSRRLDESPPEMEVNKPRETLSTNEGRGRYVETLPHGDERLGPPVATVAPVSSPAISAARTPPLQPAWGRPRGVLLQRQWMVLATGADVLLVLAALFTLNVAGVRDRLLRRPMLPPKIESIAVLPLENLSGDPEQEYFADGMTDALITNLGQIKALRVISRTTAMHFKDAKKTLPEIARELNVDGIIEGTVLRSGERVRIAAQLLDARKDRHLWAETYERDLQEVLALQGEVARDVAQHVQAKLTPQEQIRFASGQSRSVNPEAYELCLKGRYQWNKRTREGLMKALEYFQRAIRVDPSCALAYSGLADTYGVLGNNGFLPTNEVFPKAKAAALKAVELDGDLAEAHASLAVELAPSDWQGHEKEFLRAIELNPSYANAHHWYALGLVAMGRSDEAIREIEQARRLDPLSARINTNVGLVLYGARQYDRAIAELLKAQELEPSDVSAHLVLGWTYLAKGMTREALGEIQTAVRLSGDEPTVSAELARAYALSGNRKEALKILGRLKEISKQQHIPSCDFANI
ncbi:MAG TPA: winged helix-turn-helix domain-containing protein [Terriglobia bacterium]|nr:winged helix-turn-helix domain-containing protein [Terriglobia bacterium]